MIPKEDAADTSALMETKAQESVREGKKPLKSSATEKEEADVADSRPEFYYAGFVERMREPSARPLIARIRAFLKAFPNGTIEYHGFYADIVDRAVDCMPAFQGETRENIAEGTTEGS